MQSTKKKRKNTRWSDQKNGSVQIPDLDQCGSGGGSVSWPSTLFTIVLEGNVKGVGIACLYLIVYIVYLGSLLGTQSFHKSSSLLS